MGLTLTARFTNDDEKKDENSNFVKILSILICAAVISNVVGKVLSNRIFMSISKKLHRKMFFSQVNAPISHFEENTQGLIMSRFRSDIEELDTLLFRYLELMDYTSKLLIAFVIVFYLYPYLIILAFLQLLYVLNLRKKTISAVNDVIRLKFSLLGPINSIIGDAINGLPTLKCMD